MASPLADAHIEAQRRLRVLVSTAVTTIWRGLPGYDRVNVDEWLSTVLPIVDAGQRQSVSITDSYLARFLERQPAAVDADAIIAGLRGGTPPEEVYTRPFVTVWSALGNGTLWEDAVSAGLERAASTSEMDMQLAFRATANQIGEQDEGIYGYQRVADGGACSFCLEVDGAYVKSADASPLHNRCGCGLEPLTSPHPRAKWLPDGSSVHDTFAVHEHGELGAVLTDPAHDFTTEHALG